MVDPIGILLSALKEQQLYYTIFSSKNQPHLIKKGNSCLTESFPFSMMKGYVFDSLPQKRRKNVESFITKITNRLNNSFLSWLLLPFSMIIVGTVLGAKTDAFHFYPFFLLYLFLLTMGLLERYLMKKQQGTIQSSLFFRRVFLVVLAFLLILLFVAINWLAVFLLLLYGLFIFIAYHPQISLEQTEFFYILQLFFKAIILNLVAYYFQTNFISITLLSYLLPNLFLISTVIFLQQKKLFTSVSLSDLYPKTIYTKFKPLIFIFFFISIVIVFIIFHINNTPIIKQILFSILLLIFILPVTIKSFRSKIKQDNYLSLIVFVSLTAYALMLQHPMN